MRHRLNLNLTTLERLGLLIHGAYGVGKTHLQGSFLKWAKPRGPIAFINIKGEDGYLSLPPYAPTDFALCETVESTDDFRAALDECQAKKVFGLAVDSLPAYNRLCFVKVVGSLRYPDAKVDGERAKLYWGQIKMATMDGVLASRAAVPYIFWVAAYDRSEDAITGRRLLTPDLPGTQALASAGWFDFVGCLRAEAVSAGVVRRAIYVTPNETILTRQRLRRGQAITKEIPVPEGDGGWEALYGAIEHAFRQTGDA